MKRIVCQMLFVSLIAVASSVGWSEHAVTVVGVLGKKAIIVVNGERHLLAPGESTPEGYTLVSANSKGARLAYDDQEQDYPMGREISSYVPPQAKSVTIAKTNDHYYTTGSINGYPVSFLVDTGATIVAISEPLAKRLGIDYRLNGVETKVGVASGSARAWSVQFKEVKVGELAVRNVAGVVLEGTSPNPPLLGMSYLKHMRMTDDGRNFLRLEQKY